MTEQDKLDFLDLNRRMLTDSEKWEYDTVTLHGSTGRELVLRQAGYNGWELVSVVKDDYHWVFFFKRKVIIHEFVSQAQTNKPG
jgi:hypothetical protein